MAASPYYLRQTHAPDCACSVCWSARQAIPLHSPSPCPDCRPPWAALSGRWPLALPSPFLLRETRPVPASAEVLARCVRQRETHALCARARSIPIGGLTHAR